MQPSLIQKLKDSLAEDRLSESRQAWAKYIVDNQINVQELLPLLDEEHAIAICFSWLLGDIVVLNPASILPIVPYCFERRNKMPFPGFQRTVAKMLSFTGVPEEMEGIVVDELFKWLLDTKIQVAVKVHSMEVIYQMSVKYPELKEELIEVIDDQLDKNSAAFRARAKHILKKLKKV